ncbi:MULTISPECIES: STAS domain-containing protein [unclassified Sinorhizobium]|uniref:STAS domain-containing protein n=1 Tax=unclassified Sinorhizobium TaxID=2613772 RepID=UPI0035237FBA
MEAGAKYCESISLPNALSIRNVSDLHKLFIEKLRDNDNVIFEIPGEADADLSFVQLIEATRKQAKASGKSVALSAPASGSVLRVLERGGFVEAFSAEDARFWLHQEVTQ